MTKKSSKKRSRKRSKSKSKQKQKQKDYYDDYLDYKKKYEKLKKQLKSPHTNVKSNKDDRYKHGFIIYYNTFKHPKTNIRSTYLLMLLNKKKKWMTPGGHCHIGEDHLKCANREFNEEFGFDKNFAYSSSNITHKLQHYDYKHNNGAVSRMYYGKTNKKVFDFQMNNEAIDWAWVNLKDIVNDKKPKAFNIIDNEPNDSHSEKYGVRNIVLKSLKRMYDMKLIK